MLTTKEDVPLYSTTMLSSSLSDDVKWAVGKAPAQQWAMSAPNYILMAVSSALSMIGCLMIIVSYALYEDIRTSSRHIIVCITMAGS